VFCSITIIAITSNRITHPGFGTDKRCYLSSDPYNTSPCSLAYAAAGISLATAVLAGCLRVRGQGAPGGGGGAARIRTCLLIITSLNRELSPCFIVGSLQ